MAKRPPRGTSALLINEHPLQVLPSLALVVGLNESIILQQVHWWLARSDHVWDGQPWIYNSYEAWRKQFPFWSVPTIRRAMYTLQELGVLLTTSRLNRDPRDTNKWYAINYSRLNELMNNTPDQNDQSPDQNDQSPDQAEQTSDQNDQSPDQNGQGDCSNWADPCSNWTVIHRDPREIPEKSPEIPSSQTLPPAGEGPLAVAGEDQSADAPTTAPHPWERPAFPAPRQPWEKPVPPAIAACGLCDDHGMADLDTPDGTRLTARCCHDPGAMQAFAAFHAWELVRRDRSREPPLPAGEGGPAP